MTGTDAPAASLSAVGERLAPPPPAPLDAPTATPRLGVLYTYDSGAKTVLRSLGFARSRELPTILDSGAWSVFNAGAVIDPADHARFVNDLVPDFPGVRFVGLDVIGDEEATYRNWMTQRELGAPVEPTLHYGTDPQLVDRYVAEGLAANGAGETWVNCGGMVQYASRPGRIRPTMAWVAAVRKRLPAGVKLHGLGMTTPRATDIIRFDGVDSTYWLVNYMRFRTLPLFDTDARAWRRMLLIQRSTPDYLARSRATFKGLGKMLREQYGVTPLQVWEMDDMARLELSIRSHAAFADTYRARHRDPAAPIVYLAGAPSSEANPTDLAQMNAIVDWSHHRPTLNPISPADG